MVWTIQQSFGTVAWVCTCASQHNILITDSSPLIISSNSTMIKMKIWDSQGVYDLLSTITTMYYIMCSLLQPRGNIWSIQNKTCDRQQNNKVRSFSYQILSTPRREQMSWHTFIPLGRKNILCKNMIRCGSNQIVLTHRPNIHHILIEPRAYNLTKALVDRLHPSTT